MPTGSVAVIGAGPAGLTAAYLLAKAGVPVTVLESDPRYVGGISKTVEYHGYRFDIGGHRFFSKSKEVEDFWSEILPDDMLDRPRSSRILYRGKFFSYPLKAVEALLKLGLWESLLCVLSYFWSRWSPVPEPKNFEDWVSNQFGRRLFRIFFKTYTEKVWGTPCTEISADWAAQRIKGLSLSTAIANAILPKRKPKARGQVVKTLIDSFRYPRLGPGMLWEECVRKIETLGGRVLMGQQVSACTFDETGRTWNVVTTDRSGATQSFIATDLISSTPMRSLARLLNPEPEAVALTAADRLQYRDFITVALILRERHLFDDNWIYVHDPSVQVGRIQNFKSWSPEMVPDPSMACYGLEYFCFEGRDGLWAMTDEELKALASRELVQLGLAKAEDIVDASVVRQPKAYPVYDEEYAAHVETLRTSLEARFPTLQLVGRNGMHKYNNQDHSMMTAMLAVKNILAGERVYDLWAVNEDAEYHESGGRGASTSGVRQTPRRVKADTLLAPARVWTRRWALMAFLLLAGVALPFVLTLGMTSGLTHDEHQHVAAGAILARNGLLPYVDYPNFHTPYLPFIYAALFRFSDHLLLTARLFSVACAAASVGLLGALGAWVFRKRGPVYSGVAGMAMVAVVLFSRAFAGAAGHAWNQEPAAFAALLAFLVFLRGLKIARGPWLFGGGLLLGITIGLRITYAPLVAGFGLALLMAPAVRGRRFPLGAWFAGGVALGLAGLLALFIAAPEQTVFGNWDFAKVNVLYRFQTGEPRTMTLLKKFRYLLKEVVRPNLGLVLVFSVALTAAIVSVRKLGRPLPLGLRFLLVTLPFLLVGSVAPSPLFSQYFYPFALFLPLGAILAFSTVPRGIAWNGAVAGAALCVLLLAVNAPKEYRKLKELPHTASWDPMLAHDEGQSLRHSIPGGEILTLAPIFALEGGFTIYPSFVTGPFSWRISPFVDPAKAARLKMATPTTLEPMLDASQPAGILLGIEKRGEEQLAAYAQSHQYRLVPEFRGSQLWVRPQPSEAMR